MEILDEEKAKSCLARIGYYRISAYWYGFRQSETRLDPLTGKSKLFIKDDFRLGTSFSTILELYIFDKKLRLLVLDALERIEIALRTDIAILLGRHDPWAHRNSRLLHGKFARRPMHGGTVITKHQDWLDRLDRKFNDSKEDFAKHFKLKYAGEQPPIWIAVELWDFGTLSHFFAGMTDPDKNAIASRYSSPPGHIFETWLRCLNDIRNLCAHHSRLWNRPLVNQPSWPTIGAMPRLNHLSGHAHGRSRLYAALLLMREILATMHPSSSWPSRLKDLVNSLPQNTVLTLDSAGFPPGWEAEVAWL